ncbi:hypothetical protein HU200_028508 [Digitaria exilis]|uniref:Uncharacterized protein n=1 Tax=Digitaria exilis TaxID=1010633 RepID=A0A835BRZ0_9POAL|nr:hypothetical protein HU200_028508 [Digitaria exilis]CAB3481980.1 unnamed protein product [Digitaria exilis]
MSYKKTLLSSELSLSPLLLNVDVMTCWLVNMAALESAKATTPMSFDADGYVVSSYLSILAMLMDREEDVRELRRRGAITNIFSDEQTLAIFKCFGLHLRMGYNYMDILQAMDHYMRHRPLRIAIYKFFFYNNKTIAAVLPSLGLSSAS